jgi:hypothetical protein
MLRLDGRRLVYVKAYIVVHRTVLILEAIEV